MTEKRTTTARVAWIIIGFILLCFPASIYTGGLSLFESLLTGFTRENETVRFAVGEPAPSFSLLSLDGKKHRLTSYRSRPVLINFFTTWCGPCKEEMQVLQEYFQAHQSDLVILAVNEGEQIKYVEKYISELGVTFPVVLDPDLEVGRLYNVTGYPVNVLVDADGDVAAIHMGAITETDLDRFLSMVGWMK